MQKEIILSDIQPAQEPPVLVPSPDEPVEKNLFSSKSEAEKTEDVAGIVLIWVLLFACTGVLALIVSGTIIAVQTGDFALSVWALVVIIVTGSLLLSAVLTVVVWRIPRVLSCLARCLDRVAESIEYEGEAEEAMSA
jgi:hypothetical protein